MSPATISSLLDGPELDVNVQVQRGPTVVASDGSVASDAALAFAAHMAATRLSRIIVLSVVEPVTVVPMDFGIALPFSEIEQAQREARLQKLTTQLERLGLSDAGWSVQVEYGDPATTIASVAREQNAAVIITGIGTHDLADRIFGGETALRTLRACRVPVLAVAGTVEALPQRAVIATDFSVASLDAARTALALFPAITEIHLMHVMTRLEVPPDVMVTWDGIYSEPIAETFDRLTTLLDLPESVRVKKVTREGTTSREVIRYARSIGADLIVTGSRGAGFMSRLLVGSTASGIIRGADTTVLAVPAARGSDRLIGVEEVTSGTEAEIKWTELLSTFSRRNAGRRTSLEVDDPDYGLLVEEHGYPLRGVSYDRHDRRISIMLGELEGTERHLTRGIANPESVDVLRDTFGRDRALRVAHGHGQTLLTFGP